MWCVSDGVRPAPYKVVNTSSVVMAIAWCSDR
jgi:hypothetical protein